MVIDASIWVSALVPLDAHHQPSRRWLNEMLTAGEPMFAPTLLLTEVGGAVASTLGFQNLGSRPLSRSCARPLCS